MDPNPRRLILNLLLGTGGEPLSARTALAACSLFGLRESSVRVALTRLAATGMVEPVGRGNYRLGPQAAVVAAEVAPWRASADRLSTWSGGWVAVHTPTGTSTAPPRRTRERALGLLGLRELDRGLHLRPDNLLGGAAGVRERLVRLGLNGATSVFVATDLDPARERQARALWDGAALNCGYRSTRQRLDRWLARADRLPLDAAARESFTLGNDAIHQLVFDPLLPAPLVDADARQHFIEAVVRFDAAGQAIWTRFREEN